MNFLKVGVVYRPIKENCKLPSGIMDSLFFSLDSLGLIQFD